MDRIKIDEVEAMIRSANDVVVVAKQSDHARYQQSRYHLHPEQQIFEQHRFN